MADYEPPDGPRGGDTYSDNQDYVRLNQQATDVWRIMRDQQWHTLRYLATWTGHPEASVSARLRDFRKSRFGGHIVERERVAESRGLFQYRLVPNPAAIVAAVKEK